MQKFAIKNAYYDGKTVGYLYYEVKSVIELSTGVLHLLILMNRRYCMTLISRREWVDVI